ncbi:Rho-binding antiterminator [Photobacterium rosenbergii]|uniref:Rho-binding antiterminator n=1 Tax=Photobacterium rosenbergii TaxID=294936 RepID=A0ABU3ZKA6_9GAMM|nr:Rho-binding antiterminator [Photobacterium rosenbergii]MDV5170323.1 Rho-binding antiterminator [Photobacterium rosenbergii]
MTNRYQPIDYTLQNYLEQACDAHYDVLLELTDDSTVEGQCINTEIHPDRSQWLVCKTQYQYTKIRLDFIAKIKSLTPGSSFSEVTPSSPQAIFKG